LQRRRKEKKVEKGQQEKDSPSYLACLARRFASNTSVFETCRHVQNIFFSSSFSLSSSKKVDEGMMIDGKNAQRREVSHLYI
jgi:hypothetical protein